MWPDTVDSRESSEAHGRSSVHVRVDPAEYGYNSYLAIPSFSELLAWLSGVFEIIIVFLPPASVSFNRGPARSPSPKPG
jgi:hypothetical protein